MVILCLSVVVRSLCGSVSLCGHFVCLYGHFVSLCFSHIMSVLCISLVLLCLFVVILFLYDCFVSHCCQTSQVSAASLKVHVIVC